MTDPAGQTFTLTHSELGLLGELRTPRLLTHSYSYDADGRLQSDSAPDGHGLTLTRTGFGEDYAVTTTTAVGHAFQMSRERSRNGTVSRLSQSPSGQRAERVSNAGAITTSIPYGTVVTTLRSGDPRFGADAPLTYETVRYPSGRTLTADHRRTATLATSDVLSITSQTDTYEIGSRTTTETYDVATRTLHVTTPEGRSFAMLTDSVRRPVSLVRPGFAPVNFTYTRGLLTRAARGSREYAYAYDAKRRLATITDPLLRQTSFTYDDADRLLTQTLPDDRVITFAYDAAGNLASVTPPSRTPHAFTYTAGEQVETHTPSPLVQPPLGARYTYNNDRQLTVVTRPDGTSLTFAYDAFGRLESSSGPDAAITVTWDTSGRIGSVSNTANSLTYTYDGSLLTRVVSAGEVGSTVAYGYDSVIRLSSETINGTSIAFRYDGDDLLTRAGALTLTRDRQNGLLTATALGGVTDTFTYDEFGGVATYTASYAGTPLYTASYGRDQVGRVESLVENIAGTPRAREYEYDNIGRLQAVHDGAATLASYEYDSNGNRLSHVWLGGSSSATYDAQDRLLTYGDTTYQHSPNGDLQSATLAGATTTYAYDSFGNLLTVDVAGTTTIEYVTDAQNRRIGKKVNGTLVQGWIYLDQLRIGAETDGTGAVVSRFVYGSRSNTPDYMIRYGVTYRIITDHLGSPRVLISTGDGTVVQRLEYDEFGNVTFDTNPGFQPFGFAGGLYDRDTRLVRFGARDYDAHTGRWTAKEPLGFAGGDTNLYSYVASDPINWIDPSGLSRSPTDIAAMDCVELANTIREEYHELRRLRKNELDPSKQAKRRGRSPAETFKKWYDHRTQWRNRQKAVKKLLDEFNGRPCDPETLPGGLSHVVDSDYPNPNEFGEHYAESIRSNFEWIRDTVLAPGRPPLGLPPPIAPPPPVWILW